jgi:hypothetical protein
MDSSDATPTPNIKTIPDVHRDFASLNVQPRCDPDVKSGRTQGTYGKRIGT